jgi:hypothetical protein
LFGGGVEDSARCEMSTMVGPNKRLANVVQCNSAMRRALKKMERRLLELLMEIVAGVIVGRRVG